MAFLYRIYKQLIPVPLNASDPTWARRQVWVAKLNALDTVEEFISLTDAQTKHQALTAADETGRVYKITKVLAPEVGARPVITADEEGNQVLPTLEDIQTYMDNNEISYTPEQTVEDLLSAVTIYWSTPAEDVQ